MSEDSKYLTQLFSQKVDHFFCVEVETPNPAMAETNIPDLLARMQLGFLNDYLQDNDSRIFSKEGSGTHFFYNHDCPTMQSKATEISDGEDEEDFEDEDLLNIEEGSINLAETLSLDLHTPDVGVGLDIRFNEETGFYQLDSAYIKPRDAEVTIISCARDNAENLQHLTATLCPLVMKVVNGQNLGTADIAVLKPFLGQPAQSVPATQVPNGP